MTKAKFKKQFNVQKAEAPRKCVNCERVIKKGEKCINFAFAQNKTFQVTANICKKCTWKLLGKIFK